MLNIQNIDINHHLITTLVEQWRTETHAFYFPYEEATMTLKDVALQLGLEIDGEVVTGVNNDYLVPFCEPLLGFIPPTCHAIGNTTKLSWLNNAFQQLPDDVNKVVITQHARAHIMMLIIGFSMPNTSTLEFI